jgi:hypothetical protein
MKKTLCAVLALATLITCASCAPSSAKISAHTPQKRVELPTRPAPPDTLSIDELLNIVNTALEYDGDEAFDKGNANILDEPVSDEDDDVYYLFERDDVEIALVASRDTLCLTGAYFRALVWYDEISGLDSMEFYAAAFLMALEPERYESMLAAALPSDGDAPEEDVKIGAGDAWSVTFREGLMNILPAAA